MNSAILNCLKQLTNITSSLYWKKRLIVLIYHRVLDKPDFMRPGEIDISAFTWQMDLLASYFNVLPIDEAITCLISNTLPARAICITFDDGYSDNFYNALPVLTARSLPACFFIASGYLNNGRMWNDTIIESFRNIDKKSIDKNIINTEGWKFSTQEQRALAAQYLIRKIKHMQIGQKYQYINHLESISPDLPNDLMLNDQQVKALFDNGMTIGAHTVTHPILVKMSDTDIQSEIADNRTALQNIINSEVNLFAYPNGKVGDDYLPEQTKIIKDLGFRAAFTTHLGSIKQDTDRWQLPRFRPWDDKPESFMLRLTYMYSQT